MGQAPRYTIHFNARQQQTLPISQISALHIDNSTCGSSMHVGFADTQFEVVVGANQIGFYPIVTNSLEFWAWIDTTPLAQDKTTIQVLNFLPPPILFSTQPGGTSVGTVREVDTVAPIQGGPITDTGTISLATPLTINYGGTAGVTAAAALDNLSGASGVVTGPLSRSPTGVWSVAAGLSSPISVANGGTGLTTLTANRVLVGAGTANVTPSSIMTDNGVTLTVSTSEVIGLPVPAPGTHALVINDTATTPAAGAVGSGRFVLASDSNTPITFLDAYNNSGGGPLAIWRYARGTAAAPAAMQANDIMGQTLAQGHAGAAGYFTGAAIASYAAEGWSGTAQGSAWHFTSIPLGTTTSVNSLVLQGNTATFSGTVNASANTASVNNAKVLVSGPGQGPVGFSTIGNLANTLELDDATAAAGQGGAILFSAAGQAWRFAAIQGWATSGAGNTQGDIVVSTRRATADATLTETLRIQANGTFTFDGTGASPMVQFNGVTPYATLNTSGTWATLSDPRVKTDIAPYSSGLTEIERLEPISFRYNGELGSVLDDETTTRYGLDASAVEAVMPEMVGHHQNTAPDGTLYDEILTLESGPLIYALLNAVKELSAGLNVLDDAIKSIVSRLEVLEGAR
jgi:hypothetical protein